MTVLTVELTLPKDASWEGVPLRNLVKDPRIAVISVSHERLVIAVTVRSHEEQRAYLVALSGLPGVDAVRVVSIASPPESA